MSRSQSIYILNNISRLLLIFIVLNSDNVYLIYTVIGNWILWIVLELIIYIKYNSYGNIILFYFITFGYLYYGTFYFILLILSNAPMVQLMSIMLSYYFSQLGIQYYRKHKGSNIVYSSIEIENILNILDDYIDLENSCSICLSEYDGSEDCAQLICTHIFHQGCISEWLTLNATCPLCMRNVYENSELELE